MMRIRYLYVVVLLLLPLQIFAVNDSTRFLVSITPQTLLSKAIKVDFEFSLNRQNWPGISVQWYNGILDDEFTNNGPKSTLARTGTPYHDRISGMGITLSHKLFFRPSPAHLGPFIQFSGNFSIMQISYQDNGWVPFSENGLNFYHWDVFNGKINVQSFSFGSVIGVSAKIFKGIRVDLSGGIGYRTLNNNATPADGYRNFNFFPYDYQQQGFAGLFAIQFGYAF